MSTHIYKRKNPDFRIKFSLKIFNIYRKAMKNSTKKFQQRINKHVGATHVSPLRSQLLTI